MKDFKYIIALSVLMLAGSMSCYSEESRGVSSPDGKLHLIVPPTGENDGKACFCLLYTSPSPRDRSVSRMPSSA